MGNDAPKKVGMRKRTAAPIYVRISTKDRLKRRARAGGQKLQWVADKLLNDGLDSIERVEAGAGKN